ncbi:sugar ABC transporter substrate-binding protein [Pontimonas salivibrio]|nr:substrate-binding domain-containing protein [Pontimonas salivibrio]
MMLRRRSSVAFAALAMSAGLVLAGCTPAEEAAEESTDTGSESTEESTSTDGPDFSSVQVALVPGGAHPYFQPWIAGGEAAVAEFGIGATEFNETGEWDQTKHNSAIDSMAAQGFNAFGIFGVSPTDINTTFSNLNEQGFATGSLASCPAGDVNEASFCLSTDTGEAAYLATQALIEQMGGEGAIVHLTGNAVDSNTVRRIDGVQAAIDETDGAVTLLTTITDIDTDLQSAQKAVTDLLAAQGDAVNGIVTTAYNPAVAATEGVGDTGLPIKVIAIDDDQIILDAIREGTISGTVVQNPWGQAYVGSWVLAALQTGYCEMNEPGLYVDSGSFLVTTENVDTYDAEREATSKEILAAFQNDYMTCN